MPRGRKRWRPCLWNISFVCFIIDMVNWVNYCIYSYRKKKRYLRFNFFRSGIIYSEACDWPTTQKLSVTTHWFLRDCKHSRKFPCIKWLENTRGRESDFVLPWIMMMNQHQFNFYGSSMYLFTVTFIWKST